ncbi:putative TIR domain, AAA+ ATPase domain, P-loop containing nucleoside triphosphate hydrolase [Helianthus debilis subsp. tardiflorus]
MASLSYFIYVFFCMFSIYKLVQFIYRLLQFMYKFSQFVLQKISPLPKKDVEVPSLNHSAPASSSGSCKYDVFLSFRGEDVRKKFLDHFYKALEDRQIHTYKDDITLPQGESIGPSLLEAIKESKIAVIIFSKNYANSSWCLDELAHIMKCKEDRELIVMPIFYDVNPSEVRKQKGDFGKEFAKQAAVNTTKAKLWIKALVDASNISGWEPKNVANGHEAQAIKTIVDVIFDKLSPSNSNVDKNLVGMRDRLHALESHLDIEADGVRMVGIWGVGGSGKTTLATAVYMKLSNHYQGHCIMGNVREESNRYGLKKLQENMLSAVCKTEVRLQSIDEGKLRIKGMLGRRKVLVLLDDVDTLDQLEALAGSHQWFGSGSRIILTTRDEHLLKTHKVDQVSRVKLLSHNEAMQLFKIHAYNEEEPVEDYETLSLSVVSYAAGLPLALKVLGSFLYDKDKDEWTSALEKLKDIPDSKYTGEAMEMLEACGYYPKIGIKVLIQKALISIVNDKFDMHDLIQELGHYIVRGEDPDNPEKHSRLWKHEQIKNMPFWDETMEYDKIKAISYDYEYDYDHSRFLDIASRDHDDSSRLCKIVSNMKKLRLLIVSLDNDNGENAEGPNYLSNELRYIKWFNYPASQFPDSFEPMKLVVLKLSHSMQKELWKGYKHLPHLKVLQLETMRKLANTPDFDGLPRLQKLTLEDCKVLEEIHPSLGNHTSLEHLSVSFCTKLRMFPTLVHMENLKTLKIEECRLKDGDIPCGIGELSNLHMLDLNGNSFSQLNFSLSQLTRLELLNLWNCRQLLELPELPSSLVVLNAQGCNSLTSFGDCHNNCKQLSQVSLIDVRRSINDGDKLLQSMLKGKAIETGWMVLRLQGVEVAKGFRPPLLKGRRCRLELPDNWCNDFCGFLMCVAIQGNMDWTSYVRISMNQVMSGMDFQDDVVWKENVFDAYTWVGYVSFGSLRRTAWWDQTYKSLEFHIEDKHDDSSGFGVKLVNKKSKSGLTQTSTNSSSQYTPKFKIEDDSTDGVTFILHCYNPNL